MKLEMQVRPWGIGDEAERYSLLMYPISQDVAGEEPCISLGISPVDDSLSDDPWNTAIELHLPEAKRLFAELGIMIASLEIQKGE